MAPTAQTCKSAQNHKGPQNIHRVSISPPPLRCYDTQWFSPHTALQATHSNTPAHLSKHFLNDQHACWLVRCVGRFCFFLFFCVFFLSLACAPNCENTFLPWGEYITPAIQSERFSAPKLAGVKCNAGELMCAQFRRSRPPRRSATEVNRIAASACCKRCHMFARWSGLTSGECVPN